MELVYLDLKLLKQGKVYVLSPKSLRGLWNLLTGAFTLQVRYTIIMYFGIVILEILTRLWEHIYICMMVIYSGPLG